MVEHVHQWILSDSEERFRAKEPWLFVCLDCNEHRTAPRLDWPDTSSICFCILFGGSAKAIFEANEKGFIRIEHCFITPRIYECCSGSFWQKLKRTWSVARSYYQDYNSRVLGV